MTLNRSVRAEMKRAWWRIAIRPRGTFELLLRHRPQRPFLLLAIGMGLAHLANAPLLYPREAATAGEVLAWIVVVGPAFGMGMAVIGGWILSFLGRKLFGGWAKAKDARFALVWGAVPLMVGIPVWVFLVVSYWGPEFGEVLMRWRPLFAILTVWSIVVTAQTVGVAHRISAWKGITVMILAFSVVSLPLTLILGFPGP